MSAELVAIELQLKGYDGVMSDFRALDNMLNGLRGKKNRLIVESNLAQAKRDIIGYEAELRKLKQELAGTSRGFKDGNKWVRNPAWGELKSKIAEVQKKLAEARQSAQEFQNALRNISGMSFKQKFDQISSKVAHLGSAMQSAGNALTKLTNPFANFTKGIVMGAGYQALNKFTDGLQNGFTRYDTMKKYPKIMAAFGYSNEDAEKSINALDKSVRGLPTGLDEMVDMAQRFTATTGDIDKGTKLAIASNNAFLASMSTDTQKYQGMMQLQDVLGGKDMNAREWNSLVSSMTPAIVKMGEAMKKSGEWSGSIGDFIQTVRDGKMDNQEFIDQLIKIGNEGGVLSKMAEESKNTWQAFFANVGNAASRMTAGVIKALDEVSQTVTGKDVNQLLADTIIPGIDKMTASIQKWIKAHPQEIADFFKSLKQIDFASILRGAAEAMGSIAKLTQDFANMFGGRDLSGTGKFMIYGNLLGKILTIGGSLLKGSRYPIGGVAATIFELVKSVKGIRKYGLMGWLGKMVTVGEETAAGEKAIETVAETAPKMGKFATGLSKVFKGWGQIATMIGGSALVGFVSFKAFKSMLSDLKEMSEIATQINWKAGAGVLAGMTVFFGGFAKLSAVVGRMKGKLKILEGGAIISGLSLMFAGTFWADMAMIKRGFKAIVDTTQYLNDAVKNLGKLKSVGNVGGVKSKVKNAITLFNQITEMLQIERNKPGIGESDKQGLKELDKRSANTIKNVATALKSMKASVDTLNALNGAKLNTDNLFNVFGRLQHGLNMFGALLTNMPEIFQTGIASSWTGGLKSTVSNVKGALNGLVGENGILAMIPQIVNRMSGLDQSGMLLQLPGKMKKLGQVLTEAYTALQGIGAGEYFATNIDNFRAGLKSMKFAIMHLQEISSMKVGKGAVTNIQNIISNIGEAFNAEQISGVTQNIDTFVTSIKDALKSFEDLNQEIEIDITFKLSSGFYTSKNKVINEIKDAKGDIKAQNGGISFSIGVSVFFNVVTNLAGALAKISRDRQAVEQAAGTGPTITGHLPSTGGMATRQGIIYRSGGGSIFKPRGTDKIPAMLTEGEYVHRKQAVDFFGTDFMRSVNAMDVRGAMQALLTKAGSATNIGRQSIFNNTVNNNQRITQNISTNNPNFAGVRMGRFVGAL